MADVAVEGEGGAVDVVVTADSMEQVVVLLHDQLGCLLCVNFQLKVGFLLLSSA